MWISRNAKQFSTEICNIVQQHKKGSQEASDLSPVTCLSVGRDFVLIS